MKKLFGISWFTLFLAAPLFVYLSQDSNGSTGIDLMRIILFYGVILAAVIYLKWGRNTGGDDDQRRP